MLVNLNRILPKARKKGYAVGAFNTSNLEITQAIIQSAEDLHAPVIVATSEKAIQYAGIENISELIINMAKQVKIPIVLHLDHGRSFDICKECIRHGYSSVMIDASYLSFKENLRITRKVVQHAKKFGVTVEAEIGRLAGIEDDVVANRSKALYTNPAEAKCFVEKSECDALAIAVGTSHGAYKFKGTPKLCLDILEEIAQQVKIPLVLHGASGVKFRWIQQINKYGGSLTHTRGVPDNLIKAAIKKGISKINIDTDLRIAFTAGLRKFLHTNSGIYDPRAIIDYAREMVKRTVENRISIFGSKNKV